jgi:phosphatidylinositol alpha 1,6-mannosyltransferase
MRVAYFTESLYPLVDGVSRTLHRLFDTLESRDIEFRVYSPFVPREGVSWRERVRAVPYIRFPPYPDYRVSLPVGGSVRDDLAEFAPDIVHVVSPTPMAYRAQRLARDLNVPVVASFHTHFVSYFRFYRLRLFEPLGWTLLRRFYRNCARIYAPSMSIIRELEGQGLRRLELWSRGIDLRGFSPDHRDPELVESLGGPDRVPTLLLVSRLVKEKDLADLVGLDRYLRGRGVPFRLALVGDGPMRVELEAALPDAVFAGYHSGAELARWYASADVFIFPSTTETLGNVVLEALASGLPAVVVDRGGPQDLIEPGSNGYVAPANDIPAIGEYLERLLQDVTLRKRMSEAARASATSRNWEEINGGLLASYARVIAEHRGVQDRPDMRTGRR